MDNGKAGTLTRLDEIVEYTKLLGYTSIGVAYCYSMEKEAVLLREYLEQKGFKPTMVSCTVDGIKESQIDTSKTKNTVSCNPLGQANILNSAGIQFTILMGLCLGHDILLQKNLKMHFSTFIESIPSNFNLIKVEDFKTKLSTQKSPEDLNLLDLRNSEAFKKDGILGSLNCLLTDLPKQYRKLLPDKRKEVIIYCNGGIQSIYGVMFLSMKGYTNVKSLTGGYSKFLQS